MTSSRPLLIPAHADALKNNNLNTMRLFFAILVIWSHSFALFGDGEAGEPVSILLGGIYNSGNIGVLAFFAISGFLIPISYLRSTSWKRFLLRRIRRIYPGYIVAVLICSLMVVPLYSSRAPSSFTAGEWGLIGSNVLLRSYIVPSDAFAGKAVNGSLWSIGYEFWCYIGVIGLGVAGLLRRRAVLPCLAVGVMMVRVWLDATGRRPGGGIIGEIIGFPYFWFNVLPPFLLGASVYAYRQSIPRDWRILAVLAGGTILAAHLPIDDPWRDIVTRLIFPPMLVYGVFFVAFLDGVQLPDAARHGDLSYGAYLYAYPIQQMLAVHLYGKVSLPIYIVLAIGCSLIAGAASWHLVERWFLQSLRRPKAPLQQEAAIVVP